MLTSILDTHSEILKEFNSSGIYALPYKTTTINIPVKYARESALTITQKSKESYPLISVYDYAPEYNRDWNPNHQKIIDGYHSFVNNVPTKAYEFKEPIQLLLRYDVTAYLNNPMHRWAFFDYMENKFPQNGSICLNKVILPDGPVGDFVSYSVIKSDNERRDGIFELNYEFSFKVLINVINPVEINLISNFNLNLNNTTI